MDTEIELLQVDELDSDPSVRNTHLPPPSDNATPQTLAGSIYHPPLSDCTKQIRLCQIMPVSNNDGPVLMMGPRNSTVPLVVMLLCPMPAAMIHPSFQ